MKNYFVLALGFTLAATACDPPERQPAQGNLPKSSIAPPPVTQQERAYWLARRYGALHNEAGQVLVVFNEGDVSRSEAVLAAFERRGADFELRFGPFRAGVGKNGFAGPGAKREGDGKSPTGWFGLGQLFTYEKNVDTSWPFTQVTSEDKWIDDPESDDYNRHVRGPTDAKSFEKLLLSRGTYKYCLVIAYNTDPVIKGHGSAIFFHLGNNPPGPTLGCVAIPETEMKQVLKWLHPGQKPAILMGNFEALANGL